MAADRSKLPRARPQTANACEATSKKSSLKAKQRPTSASLRSVVTPSNAKRQRKIPIQRPTTAGILRRCDCGDCWCYKMPGITIPLSGVVGNAHIPFERTQTPSVAYYNIKSGDKLIFRTSHDQTFSRAYNPSNSLDQHKGQTPGVSNSDVQPKTKGGVIGNSERINLMYTTGGGSLKIPLSSAVDREQSSPGPCDYARKPTNSRLSIKIPRGGDANRVVLAATISPPKQIEKKHCSCSPGFAKWKRPEAETQNPFLPKWANRNAIRIGC